MGPSTDHPIVEVTSPSGTSLYVSLRGPVEVGRECDGLIVADPQVSRRHLRLDVGQGGAVTATDLGSTNGSTIDGARLEGTVPLRPGATLRLGDTTIRLDAPAAGGGPVSMPERTATPSGTIVAGSVPPAAPAADRVVARPAEGGVRQTSIDIVAASAADDGVDAAMLPADQGTVTIVFSDIESSTERNVQLGDQVWFEVLGVHNKIVGRRVAEYGGTIIKNQGDGFMLSFPGARRALDCMADVQRDLMMHGSAHPDRKIRIRIGMHTGEVLTDDDGDLFGQHVVVAARVANLASGGEILVSSLTREIIASRGDVRFGEPRQVSLKGIGESTVYPIDWARD